MFLIITWIFFLYNYTSVYLQTFNLNNLNASGAHLLGTQLLYNCLNLLLWQAWKTFPISQVFCFSPTLLWFLQSYSAKLHAKCSVDSCETSTNVDTLSKHRRTQSCFLSTTCRPQLVLISLFVPTTSPSLLQQQEQTTWNHTGKPRKNELHFVLTYLSETWHQKSSESNRIPKTNMSKSATDELSYFITLRTGIYEVKHINNTIVLSIWFSINSFIISSFEFSVLRK